VELIRRNLRAGRLRFTTDPADAYGDAEAIFICVGTPPKDDGDADLSGVLAVAKEIGKVIDADENGDRPKIVVVKSTVPVGTHEQVKHIIASQTRRPFRIASNPEFLKEGQAVNDFNKPDRVVLGVEDRETGERLRELYEPFVRQGNPIFIMDIPSAEMVKYASNAMLAAKISFINEVAGLCEKFGADIDEVRRGMVADTRIGNQFLYPGLGYGGSCFPKDVLACIGMGRQTGLDVPLMTAIDEVNRQQRRRFIEKIEGHFGQAGVAGKRIAVWGLAFKPGTDDMREAPSVVLLQQLIGAGARVKAYDPVANDTARRVLPAEWFASGRLELAEHQYDVLDDAAALALVTEWKPFRYPDFGVVKKRMKQPVIFDGRNLYDAGELRGLGFEYFGIGR
jgi:UDPglucose 6-dehydrogenase